MKKVTIGDIGGGGSKIFHFRGYVIFELTLTNTAQKMKFSIKDFFSKCDPNCSFLRIWSRIWSYSLKKSLMLNFVFYAVKFTK